MFEVPADGKISLSKLREMLNVLKMPTIGNVPVHLEIILQIEGKSVLVFFVNQKTFEDLTNGDGAAISAIRSSFSDCGVSFSYESDFGISAKRKPYQSAKPALAVLHALLDSNGPRDTVQYDDPINGP